MQTVEVELVQSVNLEIDFVVQLRQTYVEMLLLRGFPKGANFCKENLWHTSDKTPKKGKNLLLYLSNGMLVFGKFEGWGYSFSIPEENLPNKIEVIKWMYLKDIL